MNLHPLMHELWHESQKWKYIFWLFRYDSLENAKIHNKIWERKREILIALMLY